MKNYTNLFWIGLLGAVMLCCSFSNQTMQNSPNEDMFNYCGFSWKANKNGHWIISAVIPYGPAEKCGLKPFDIVLEINGIPTHSLKRAPLAEDGKLEFTLLRLGKQTLKKTLYPIVLKGSFPIPEWILQRTITTGYEQ